MKSRLKQNLKLISSFFLISAFTLVFCNSCEREQVDDQNYSAKSSHANQSNNDTYLMSILDNSSLDCYDIGQILLEEEQLSPAICNKIIERAGSYDPYMVELALLAQPSLTDNTLMNIITCTLISDNSVKLILAGQAPLSNSVATVLQSERPLVSISEINGFSSMGKMICACDNKVYFASNIISVVNCETTEYFLENTIVRNSLSSSNPNSTKMIGGCGKGWTCGHAVITDIGNGDTHVSCNPPTDTKCVKVIGQKAKTSLSSGDQGIINYLTNSNVDDFEKGKHLLNSDEISDAFMERFIDYQCNIDPFIFEIVIITAGKLSDENLAKLIVSKGISDPLLTNILIVNTPLSSQIISLIGKTRSNINIPYIMGFDNKRVGVSLCCQQIIIGDEFTLTDIGNNSTQLEVSHHQTLSFINPVDPVKYVNLEEGCGKRFVCGRIALDNPTNGGGHIYICTTPPNKKCLQVAK